MTTSYLIEYAIDGETFVDLMNAFNTARLLEKGFESAYYTDIPFDVLHLARYDNGALIPLHIVRSGEPAEPDDNDYLHYPREVRPVDGPPAAEPEFTFTVSIDGRA